MRKLLRKLFPKKPQYEPIGIIPGCFEITIGDVTYWALGNAHGLYELWADDEPLGEYTERQALLTILDHKKQQQRKE